MFTVEELLSRLAYGEFKNLALPAENESGVIKDKFIPMILNHANSGLIKLGGKFVLKQKELILVTVTPITKYYLRKEYAALNNAFSTTKYIDDSLLYPFDEDILRVLNIYDETGKLIPLNDRNLENSINTYENDCLQVPTYYIGTRLSVIYQAKHTKLSIDALDQEIQIPFYLESALQSYIAGKVLSNMNSPEATAKGQEHMLEYERICSEIEEKDLLINSSSTTNTKLIERGFM